MQRLIIRRVTARQVGMLGGDDDKSVFVSPDPGLLTDIYHEQGELVNKQPMNAPGLEKLKFNNVRSAIGMGRGGGW